LEHIEDTLGGHADLIDLKLIGMVWLYFEQRPSQRAARDVRYWVAQAASTDETREHLRWVRAEPGRLIATDGHRLHMAEVPAAVAGFLHPTTLTAVDVDAVFPPYEQVVPAMPEGAELVGLDDFEPVSKDSIRLDDIHFNRRYVLEAFAGSDTMLSGVTGALDPVRFESVDGKRVAVIMPMRG
jgi:hypothetical protein